MAGSVSIVDIIIFLLGLAVFIVWLLKTSCGKTALEKSPPRRNNLPPYTPFVVMFFWLGIVALSMALKEHLLPHLPDRQNTYINHLLLCFGAVTAMTLIILLARNSFARRLKGFGLVPKNILKDSGAAMLNLLSIYPLVILALLTTMFFGKLIGGPGFQLQKHEELELMGQYKQLSIRIVIAATVILITPIFEEMLFRGMFQSVFRSYLVDFDARRPNANPARATWLAIIITSGLFAVIHANPEHWPALFVLSMGMGYAYEKNGSLLRPIFIHAFFNAASMLAVWQNTM
jgi:membrane protease YdiL (CAAX protease family)